jgi:DNA-binding CsgD family transcriptional regulator
MEDTELGRRALAYVDEIGRVENCEQLATAMRRAILPLGFTMTACGVVSGPKVAAGNPFYFADWPPDWVTLYQDENFVAIDPMTRWAKVSAQSISISQVCEQLSARDPGRRVVDAGRSLRVTEGLLVPVAADGGSPGLVSVSGERDALQPQERAFLEIVSTSTMRRAVQLDESPAVPKLDPALTKRELDCIALLVRGLGDRDIAAKLGISEPTVRFHLDGARRKTGAISRTHLAALAMWLGLARL